MNNDDKDLQSYIKCAEQARIIIDNPLVFKNWNNITDVDLLTGILYNLRLEKEEQSLITDTYIDYNDEIVSIEECDDMELMDITVSGDNLFYINDIVTKNSHGVAMTADLMFGLISTPELEQLGHLRIKQLKNRFNSVHAPSSFLVGIARAKMSLFDVDLPQTRTVVGNKDLQENLAIQQPVANNTIVSGNNAIPVNKPLAAPNFANKPALKTNLKF